MLKYRHVSEQDPKLREALEDLQGYLADHIAPLLVADAVETLLGFPPALTAEQLRIWAHYQYQGRGGSTPVSDFLYHAIKKVQQLEVHQLVPADRFDRFLAGLAVSLLAACPEGERERLAAQLRHLRESVGGATGLVDHLHRSAPVAAPATVFRPAAPVEPLSPEEIRDLRRFTVALERAAAAAGPAKGGPPAAEQAQQLLVLAAAGARSDAELEERMAKLRAAGLATADAPDLLRSLVAAVPDWALTLPVGESAPTSGSLAAVRQAVKLAGNRERSGERWRELLRAAAEQFNRRSFGRTLALVELADRMVREGEVDARFAAIERDLAHEAYDVSVLLEAAADRRQWPVLRRLVEFHPAWSVRELLDSLADQADAKRRRLLLALIEVWGPEARPLVLERLEASVFDPSRDPNFWWYQRNLVYLLNRLPRGPEADPRGELDLVGPFTELAHPPAFQKEAILLVSQLPQQAGVPLLVQRLAEAERALERPEVLLHAVSEVWKVIGALAGALARSGSAAARRALLDHALARRPRDGEALARLRELAHHDLSSDRETVSRLLGALRDLAPRKLLGFVVARHEEELGHVARALAGTSAPEVRQALAELAAKYPQLATDLVAEPAEARAGAVPGSSAADERRREPDAGEGEELEAGNELPGPAAAGAGRASMAGDLEVFGLAGLIQSFYQSESSGRLALRDGAGREQGQLRLQRGRLAACRVGELTGKAAFYQLFEYPVAGTFEFTREVPGAESELEREELLALLMEGIRRYDELQRLRALVPDELPLRATGARPTAPPGETDGELVRQIWGLVRGGARAVDCERAAPVDAFRVRTLLSHWLEEGALAFESG